MPAGAITEQDGTITWTARGKRKTGKLSGTNRVSIQSDTWTAQFSDETGKVRRISTKTTNRSVAEKVLAQHEKNVDRIKSGIVTREELDRIQIQQTSLKVLLEQFRIKLTATGDSPTYIKLTVQQVASLFDECKIDAIAKIRKETIERWIADEIQQKVRSINTINCYLTAVKIFTQYLTEIGALANNPFRLLHKLNADLDRRKIRRAMKPDEVACFLQATASGKNRNRLGNRERVLIYRLLLGTGLRSTELSLLTPSQIDIENCRLTIDAVKTKNKTADVLPIRTDLVQSLKEWIAVLGIKPHERIFRYNNQQLLRAFYKDLKAAGIKRIETDGRSIDIHSLRKTFGTMLATAGVPLTTVQRLMRHSTPTLTAKLYIDVESINLMQALEQLPEYCPIFPDDTLDEN